MYHLRRLHPSCASAGLQDISDIMGYFSPSDIKLHRWRGKTYPCTCVAFPWPSPPSCGYVYIWLPTFASVAAVATGENLAHVLLKPSSFDSEKTWQVVWKCPPPHLLFFGLIHYLPRSRETRVRMHSWGATRAQAWLIRVGNPLKYKGTEPSYVPGQCERVCVSVCVCIFNLDPLVCAQSIFPPFYLVTNEAPTSVQRKENSFKYHHCNHGACLSASLLSHWEMTV